MKKQSKQKKNLPNIILAIFFLVGLGIFLYPSISDFINVMIQSREINRYENLVSELSLDDYNKMISDAQEYNKTLVENTLAKNTENAPKTNYKNLLSVDNSGIMGYLYISKIDVKLPIYHGTSASTLQSGIGHLEGSSLPVEGESTHVVISGHTGLPSAKLLTDLVELEVGDTFKIDVLNKKYTYEIDQILVVEPDETDALEIVPNKQYATIITCTPYGVNTHRLLVRGVLKENVVNDKITSDASIIDSSVIVPIISIPLIILLFIIMINIRKKRRDREENEENKNIKNDSN